jgi:hypothetical protein
MKGPSTGTTTVSTANTTATNYTITLPAATGTVALTTNLSQFAPTTSAQLAGVLSDETGTGLAVFATSPTLTTPNLGVASATSVAATGTVTGSNLSGTNTGDETTATIKTKLGNASALTDGYLTAADWTTFNAKGTGDMLLAGVQSVTGLKTFDNSRIAIKGTSTGTTTVSTANTTATNYTITLPSATGTVALTTNLSQFASTTSAQLAGVLSDETGTGLAVFATSPNLTTPNLGVASATSINGLTPTALATGFSIAGGTVSKTLTVNRTLTLTGTDGTTMTFPTTNATLARTDAGQTFTGTQTFSSLPVFSTLTQGSIPFAGAGGAITQDNANLFFDNANNRLGIGTTTPSDALNVVGDIKVGNATTGTVKSNLELVMRQDGDIYGPSILRLRNRDGENGAIFETTDPSITLVDFIFKTAGPFQRNIRFEARAAYARTGVPSFEIAGLNADLPTLSLGDNYAAFAKPLYIGKINTDPDVPYPNPTALLELAPGTATAGTAPLKFTSGPVLTAVENGAVEYNSPNYYVSSGGTRYTLAKTLTTTATLDFPATNPQNSSDLNISDTYISGAAVGDAVVLGAPSGAVLTNSAYTAWVSAAGQVTVRFNNYYSVAQNPASGTFRVSVLKY